MTGRDLEIVFTVLPLLRRLNRRGGPMVSVTLADFLDESDRTVRRWLRRLEELEIVERPHGLRSGWMVRA